MDQSYNQLFESKELLEENRLQTVHIGFKKSDPNFKVLIHKFNISERFNSAFGDLLDSALQNKLHIEETDEQIILVSKLIEGDNISLHLNFANVTESERLDYLHEYLRQAVAYIGFDHYLFNVLISSNQIVFKNQQLYLKEQIILDKRLDDEIPFTMIAKNIGQVLQRLLITNFNELRTSIKYDALYQFTESLIRREKDYVCFDDVFNDFKAIYFTKTYKKHHVLLGDAHPNNMFLEQTQEAPIPTPIVKPTPVTEMEESSLTEVTQEERAHLTGPIEENIDLSKLKAGTYSFDDLIVKSKKQKEMLQMKEEIFHNKITIDPPANQSFDDEIDDLDDDHVPRAEGIFEAEEIDSDSPVYGVPKHFKEDQSEDEIENERKNNPINAKLILIPIACLLLFLTVWLGLKWFNREPGEMQVPVAEFEAKIEGDVLICTNLSQAFNDAYIVESYWVLSLEGEEIANKFGSNKADFRVASLKEGVYTIKLTVTDSNNQFSDPFILEKEYRSTESRVIENQALTEELLAPTQKFTKTVDTSKELLDEFIISTTDNVTLSQDVYNTGDYAYQLDLTNGEGTIYFNDMDIPPNSTVSFYVTTDKTEPIEVLVEGFKNGQSNYSHAMRTNNAGVLSWTVVSVQLNLKDKTDRLEFTFPKKDMNIWFDDLSIRTFK